MPAFQAQGLDRLLARVDQDLEVLAHLAVGLGGVQGAQGGEALLRLRERPPDVVRAVVGYRGVEFLQPGRGRPLGEELPAVAQHLFGDPVAALDPGGRVSLRKGRRREQRGAQ